VSSVETFERHLRQADIVDPYGIHSEFSQTPGLHGQKIDFDRIESGSALFDEWVDVTAEAIDDLYSGGLRPEVLVAVANGTNRLVQPVAEKLGKGVVGLMTKKVEGGLVVLTPESYQRVKGIKPELAVVLDDVGTTGRNARSAVRYTKNAGAKKVEVLYTWQRQSSLEELNNRRIRYNSIIRTILPTFTPSDCAENSDGLCAQGWWLNPYSKKQ